VFAVKKIRKKSVKERAKERDSKKREVEGGCVADCVIKSLISVTSRLVVFGTATFTIL
jgi:hypothetical protein